MQQVGKKGQMECTFHWSKTVFMGLILGAMVSSCQSNLPEPHSDKSNKEMIKASSTADSSAIMNAPPRDVGGGG
jgi:hypothetical protein